MRFRSFKSSLMLITAGAISFGGLVATTANADVPPEEDQYYVASIATPQNPNENTVNGFTLRPADAEGNNVRNGVTMRLDLSSCGSPLATQTVTASDDGGKAFLLNFSNSQIRKVGRSIEYTVTFEEPGYDAYTHSGSYDGYNVKRPSCDEIKDPLVVKWSKKQGAARVGSVARVTPTTASGAMVSYTWRLLPKTHNAASGRSVRVTRAMRGQKLSMRIRVTKAGSTPKTRVLDFGRVR